MTSREAPLVRPVVAGVAAHQPAVVRYALREAARLGTGVRVVRCYAVLAGDVYFGADPDGPMQEPGSEVLDQARRVVEASGQVVDVEYVLERGDPASLLLAEAEADQLVVVGADAAGWLDRMLGGDVSGHLASRAACPVVVVPHALRGDGPVDGVVVTLDGDTSSAGPLRYGFEQADFRAEDLHVLHAVPVATTAGDTAALTAKVARDVAQWNAQTPDVRVLLSLTTGNALHECIRATAHASLLVIGRPHGYAHSFALTRPVAMLVLREARCAVAIVPADYRPVVVPPAGVAV
jgi:nucleotide-binding universal stress UspA family protein